MAKHAVVVGGGIGGLATAALLAKAGMRVELFEARDHVGGRASIWEQDGFKFDMGPSWYLMPDAFDQFFRLMGTSTEEQLNLVRLDPAYQTRNEGQQDKLLVRADVADNKALFDAIEPGSGERLQAYLNSAEETYELAKGHFLYTNFTNAKSFVHPNVLRKAKDFVSHLLTSLDDFAGQHVTDPRLRKILDFPAVFLGASPYQTPSMYHLMTHIDMNVGVFYPMGGLYTIIQAIERLAREHGVEIHTNSPVSKIHVDNGGSVWGVQVGSAVIEADVIVANGDLHHVETQLLEPQHQTYPQRWWNKRIPGPSAVLLYLGVKGELPELDHHTLLYTDDWSSNFAQVFKKADGKSKVPTPASLYICKPSATDPSVAPAGYENVFVLVPIAADPAIGKGGIDRAGDPEFEAAADVVIQQISEWCNIPDLADRIVLRRTMGPQNFVEELNAWSGTALGMAHTLKQSAFFRPSNKSAKVRGLYYVGHHSVPGIGLPMCLIGAELVYKRLIGNNSAGPLAEPITPQNDKAWKGIR